MKLTTTKQDGIITKTITVDGAADFDAHAAEFDALMSAVEDEAGDPANVVAAIFSVSYREVA